MLKHLSSVILEKPVTFEPSIGDADKLMALVSQTQGIGNWRVDVKRGVAFWSPRVFEIHGMEPSDGPVDLNEAIRVYHPDDARTVAWLVVNSIENQVGYTFVLRLVRKNGEIRLVEAASSVEVNVAGETVALYGILKDVTDRYSEKDVAEGRSRLVRSIISHSPGPLAVLDRNMHYLEVSPSWVEFHRLAPAHELIGKNHYEVMPDLPEKFRQHNDSALAGETIYSQVSYSASEKRTTTEHGAAIFPWRTSTEEIGGIIIMITPPDKPHALDPTLTEIANLFGQVVDNLAPRATSVHHGAKRPTAKATKKAASFLDGAPRVPKREVMRW